MRRATRRLLLIGALLMLGVFALAHVGCVADELVLGENHDRVDPHGAERRMVMSHGRSIECWVVHNNRQPPKALVMYFCGKMDRADRWISAVAEGWHDFPVEVWGMNYPGSGGTVGPVRMASVVPDALAVFDQMRREPGGQRIFVQGGSFGTTVALGVAARRPVAALILHNPPALRQLIVGNYGWWNLWLLAYPVSRNIPPELDSVANAASATAPAVFVMSDQDRTVPHRYHLLVANAYAGPKRLIDMPTAGHDSPLTREAADALDEGRLWLWSQQNVVAR